MNLFLWLRERAQQKSSGVGDGWFTPLDPGCSRMSIVWHIQPKASARNDDQDIARALARDGNTRYVDYQARFPPPKASATRWPPESARGLYLRFGTPDGSTMAFTPPPALPCSFIWLQSGDLKFYHPTLLNTKALIRPAAFSMRSCSRWTSIEASSHRAPRRYRPTVRSKWRCRDTGVEPGPARRRCARAGSDGAAASRARCAAPLLRCAGRVVFAQAFVVIRRLHGVFSGNHVGTL
nr:hypothetical protein [Burkholderia sp. ABCPW 14]